MTDRPSSSKAAPGPVGAHDVTDLANARRLVAANVSDLHYCHEWGTWLVWDGQRWREDNDGHVKRLAHQISDSLWIGARDCADDASRRRWLRHCEWSGSRKGLDAMLYEARALPGVPIAPEDIDADPWILNVANGTVDLRSGSLMPHDRARLCTKTATGAIDADLVSASEDRFAKAAPVFTRFLETSVGDPEKISYLQRCMGYSLTGMTNEEVLLYLWGPGRNGKSKFLGGFIEVLGDYAAPMPHDLLVMGRGDSHPQRIASFHGKRLAVVSEVPADARLDVELLKVLTGGDTLSARRMRENQWSFAPTHTLWMMANTDPRISDRSVAVWERMRKVPFDRVFSGPERDRDLAEKLRSEYPALLAWAVTGCLEWQRIGLAEPQAVRSATADYQQSQDWMAEFVAACCYRDDSASAYSGDLYERYVSWAGENDHRVVSQKAFTQDLKAKGLTHVPQHGKSRKPAIIGLGLSA